MKKYLFLCGLHLCVSMPIYATDPRTDSIVLPPEASMVLNVGDTELFFRWLEVYVQICEDFLKDPSEEMSDGERARLEDYVRDCRERIERQREIEAKASETPLFEG